MVRILVDGEGSRAVELCIRAALGDRANGEQWLISAVKLPARWVVSFLVSKDAGYMTGQVLNVTGGLVTA